MVDNVFKYDNLTFYKYERHSFLIVRIKRWHHLLLFAIKDLSFWLEKNVFCYLYQAYKVKKKELLSIIILFKIRESFQILKISSIHGYIQIHTYLQIKKIKPR